MSPTKALSRLKQIKYSINTYMNVNFQADIGQDEDFEAAREKATKLGAKKVMVFFLHILKEDT